MGSGAFTLVMCSSTRSSPASSSSAQYLGREINSGLLFAVTCHWHRGTSWWQLLPAPGLWLIVTLVLRNDEVFITLISSLFCPVIFAELQKLECFIILTALLTHTHIHTENPKKTRAWVHFKDIFKNFGCFCKGLLTFLFIAYFNWALPLIISSRSSRFCLFNSSSWWRIRQSSFTKPTWWSPLYL